MKELSSHLEEFSHIVNQSFKDYCILLLNKLNTEIKKENLGLSENNIEKNKTLNSILNLLTEIEEYTNPEKLDLKYLEYFDGRLGYDRLVRAFQEQELVNNNALIAKKLAEFSELEIYKQNQKIYKQGELAGDHFFMVLIGQVELQKDGQQINIITSGGCFGEFPMIIPTDVFYLNAISNGDSIVAKIPIIHFLDITEEYPEIWKNLARMLAKRLRNSANTR
ncbi:MAG: cyclic nucleotide-binding domain-containing protein [Haliscomenobacter sp.]|uniref:cyclic nucleotide-binding domain-containing protein n=1 Tax=Haliscomenobacter sp. TaxID=2717303 RepID=UPI0029AFBB05|nr:cyclic nucleotide-binding domain-containing protein [Haliscomenobacter sp.]MDX2070797.1 cyclic nucleotide-binding domain-containing protein [Haliscomenobacter sp.]